MQTSAVRSRLGLRGFALLAPIVTLVACSRSEPEPVMPTPPPQTTISPNPVSKMPACPLSLPQASADVVDRPEGVALEFAVPRDEEKALKSRVENIEKDGDRGLLIACPCGAPQGELPQQGTALGPGETSEVPRRTLVPPPSTVSTEDSTAGMRLIFRAKDERDVGALRRAVRTLLEELITGACGGM